MLHVIGIVLIRPFVAIALLLSAAYIARWLRPVLPDNRLVRFLYRPRSTTAGLAKPLPKGWEWLDRLVPPGSWPDGRRPRQ